MAELKQYATEAQLIYSTWLDWGMRIGFVILVISFGVYLTGIVPPHVPVDQLPQLWDKPVGEYLAATQVHTGWSWVSLAHKGDYLNFIGVAILSVATIICYARILPILHRNGDRIYLGIAVVEILVLALAASGLLVAGH